MIAPTVRPERVSKASGLPGLVVGRLPPGCSWVKLTVSRLRRTLEAEVKSAKGKLGVQDAALCQSAARHEATALLAGRWLRKRWGDVGGDGRVAEQWTTGNGQAALKGSIAMDDGQRLAWLLAIGRATDARDRCIRQLGLDTAGPTLASLLYGTPRITDIPEPTA